MIVYASDPRSGVAFEQRIAAMSVTPARRQPPPIPPPRRRMIVVDDRSPDIIHTTEAGSSHRRDAIDAVRRLPGDETARLNFYEGIETLHVLQHRHGPDALVDAYEAAANISDPAMRSAVRSEIKRRLGC